MNRLSTPLIAMSLSICAFAVLSATAAPCVSVPQLPCGFSLGITGYYLQPRTSQGDLDYAIVNNDTAHIVAVDPKYNWGWGISAGYVFPCTANDINLSYFHLNTHNNDSVFDNGLNSIISATNQFNFPLSDPEILNPTYIAGAHAKARYKLNQVGLAAGQYINIGCRFMLHPVLGLRWLELERNLTTRTTQSSTVVTTTTIVQTQDTIFEEKSRFQGIGPLAGLDASYCIACGLGIVGHFDTALLVGSRKNLSTQETIEQITTVPGSVSDSISQVINFNADHLHRVVPVIDMKLGANYTWIFKRCCNSALTLEAGWTVSNYFNVVDRLHTVTTLQNGGQGGNANSMITFATINGHSTANVTLSGPYISLVFRV